MAQAIALVRAVALLPSLRWLERQDVQIEGMLRRRGLSAVLHCSPMRPVPLLHVGALLRDIAERAGPDAPCQIVSETDARDLVQVGRVALGTRNPAEALARISMALPYFCSHELLSLEPSREGLVVRHAYGAAFDAETRHLMVQYALAVLDRLCAMNGSGPQRLARVEMPGHPVHGLAHLEPWFGRQRLVETGGQSLTVVLPETVASRPFGRHSRDRSADLMRLGLRPLRNDDGFSGSVRTLIAAMLEDEGELPALARVAEASGLSIRTFQRRLQQEGRPFKSLLDEARRAKATRLIADGGQTVSSVATLTGYARPTSLNRSMLRWTGQSPSAYRRGRS